MLKEQTWLTEELAKSLDLVSGATTTISGLKCFGTTQTPFATAASLATIGTPFTGFIYMNYTTNAATPMTGNWYTQKVAVITMKVV